MFGERLLLPMTQTGFGALSMQDAALIQTGYHHMVVHPQTGEYIVFVDHTRTAKIPSTVGRYNTKNAKNRNHTKILHLRPKTRRKKLHLPPRPSSCPCHPDSCMNALPCILVPSRPMSKSIPVALALSHYNIGRTRGDGNVTLFVGKLMAGHPVKLKGNVMVKEYNPAKQTLLDFTSFKPLVYCSTISSRNLRSTIRQGHLQALDQHGFTMDTVSTILGGSLNLDQSISQWTRMRLSLEDNTSSSISSATTTSWPWPTSMPWPCI